MNWVTLVGLTICLSLTFSLESTVSDAPDAQTDVFPTKREYVFPPGNDIPGVLPGTHIPHLVIPDLLFTRRSQL